MFEVTTSEFPILWNLEDVKRKPTNGKKVFGTFVCCGGSAMGYKLAGYEYLGGLEFLQKYADIYEGNLNPKYLFVQDIRNFRLRDDLPDELYQLDILDGSPPCAAFSMSGRREKIWGKVSVYENTKQVKDDLVYEYAELVNRLRPKVLLMENVKGLAVGNARKYLYTVLEKLGANYRTQVFVLNSATMGVPQARERLFIIGLRRDFDLPKLELKFNCPPHPFKETEPFWNDEDSKDYSIEGFAIARYWDEMTFGAHKKHFNLIKPVLNRPCPTIIASQGGLSTASVVHPIYKRKMNKRELLYCSTFPQDYDFMGGKIANIVGRAVPPIMMAQISSQIYKQWLSKL